MKFKLDENFGLSRLVEFGFISQKQSNNRNHQMNLITFRLVPKLQLGNKKERLFPFLKGDLVAA
jgi:hypothetical protein